jgi:phage FluMu gp28-like protein
MSGRDASVLTVARVLTPPSAAPEQPEGPSGEPRLEVVEQRAWRGEPHDRLYGALLDLLRDVWRVRRVAIDATGLGETLARWLTRALGSSTVASVRFTAESKSRLGYNLLASVNGGRLKMYAADGSQEYRLFWQEMERARVAYRANRTMSFFVDPAEGHDDYLVSLSLAVEAASGAAPRRARGRLRQEA